MEVLWDVRLCPRKLPGNPGDLINLHFPPAALCRGPISLRNITSLPLWNESLCGKKLPAEWGWHIVHVCVKKNQPVCTHEQMGGITSATLRTWAVRVKEKYRRTFPAESQSWMPFENGRSLCAQNRRETEPVKKLLVLANIKSTCHVSAGFSHNNMKHEALTGPPVSHRITSDNKHGEGSRRGHFSLPHQTPPPNHAMVPWTFTCLKSPNSHIMQFTVSRWLLPSIPTPASQPVVSVSSVEPNWIIEQWTEDSWKDWLPEHSRGPMLNTKSPETVRESKKLIHIYCLITSPYAGGGKKPNASIQVQTWRWSK